VKQELTAAATLTSGLGAQRLSINSFGDQFKLSQAAREAVVKERGPYPHPPCADDGGGDGSSA
jgi:hypothetical protein